MVLSYTFAADGISTGLDLGYHGNVGKHGGEVKGRARNAKNERKSQAKPSEMP